MKIRILGAGFSGLTLAYLLIRKGFQVEVIERDSRVGGLIQTHRAPNLFSESAANGLIANEKVLEMFKELGLDYLSAQKQSAKRFIFRGSPKRWPLTLFETLAMALRFLSNRIRRHHRPRPFETVTAWGNRILGTAATSYLLQPALQGIYAGDIQHMSASLILGKFFAKKKNKLGQLISPVNGMEELLTSLVRYIKAHGGQVNLNCKDTTSNESIPTLYAISSQAYQHSYFDHLELLSLVKVTVRWQKPAKKLNGYGILFPRDQGIRAIGVLSSDSIFGRTEELDTEAWIYGGATDPELTQLSDAEILKLIAKDRESLFGSNDQMVSYKVCRWPRSLPHYNLDLEKHLNSLSHEEKMLFSGNFMGELGLSRIFLRNIEIAEYWGNQYGT